MQLVGKFLGEQIARIYEKIGLHTGDNSIHRTSAEIRAEITEGDIPSEIARQTEVERALAGKVDKIDGKELMPSPGETPRRDRFLNEQGEYIPLESDYMVLDATMMGEKEFLVDQAQLQEYIDRAIVGGDSGLTVFFKFPSEGWNEYYKVTLVRHRTGSFGNSHLIAVHPIQISDERMGMREYRYIFFYDLDSERPFIPGKGVFIDSEFYVPDYLDTLLEAKADDVEVLAHVGNTENPHRVTKSQLGLEHVENTADADKPVSKPVQQALDGIAGQLQSHAADAAIHRTSAQIRAEITDADIPGTIARDADVDTKIQAHNESGEAHADLRNALANLESGTVETGSAVYAQKLGTAADSYTKTQLDAKLNRHIKDVVYDAGHAKFTFVFEDGREIVVDTPLENTVTDGHYDNETLELVLVLVSGQEIRIPVAGMTKVYTGKDTATATTTINDAGEVSVALKTGGVDAVHLTGALLSAINSHLTSTGDTKDNITTFPDQGTRTNLASGDKHSVLFGKIKRWFSDLKTVAFTGKASDLTQDAGNRLVTDTEKAGWNDKYTRAEVDTKDAGKANLVHTHTKAQITDFPAALPANGGNADTVDGYHAIASQDVTVANMGDKIPVYDTNGYLSAVIFRDNWTREDNQSIAEICYRFSQEDGYHRWCSLSRLKSVLGSMPANGGNADTVDGVHAAAVGKIEGSKLVSYDEGGCIAATYYLQDSPNNENIAISQVIFTNGTDTAFRKASLSHLKSSLGSMPANGGNADTVGGRRVAIQSVDITPSQLYNNIPVYTNAGYLNAVIFKDSWVVEDSNTISDICYRISKADGYHRWCSLARLKSVLGSMPASDVYAWAKQANKPAYNINEIYDANVVWVDAETVNRKIFIANHKPEGYISRAAIGLTNPSNRFSPVTVSAGLNDNGTSWADWVFDPANGRITNPSGKAFAYVEEVPDVSDVLRRTGTQVIAGDLHLNTPNSSIVQFFRNGVTKGYIGCGSASSTDVFMVNYPGNSNLRCADDGKCYANGKEIATVDQISGGTIPDASTSVSGIVNTGAQEFSGRKAFRGGIDITSGGMTVNGGIAVTNGTIACTGEVSAANGFFVSSDIRLKKNIVNIRLSERRIRLCEFDKADKHSYGVIAQEVEELYPTVVKEENGYKVVNYLEVLTIKCAEQDERIEALERENSSLKERLERLENLLLK